MNNPLDNKKNRPMATTLLVAALGIGLAAGILSGLVGIGGGIIMVPALVLILNYSQHQAQGTSLAVLTLPVVIIASIYYYQHCQQLGEPIDLKVVGLLAIGFVFGAWGGSKLASLLSEEILKKIFAIVLFYTAFKMLNWDNILFKWIKNLF
jgi:uncharacterized membrane protein YfcA